MKRKTGHTAMVTLNRPERLDALNPTLKGEVTAALQDAVADETVRVVVITGGRRPSAPVRISRNALGSSSPRPGSISPSAKTTISIIK